jgi:hypothetical protein
MHLVQVRTHIRLAGILAAACLFFVFSSCELAGPQSLTTQKADAPAGSSELPAVLVELFTSEGCSTCPPADKLLTDLDQAKSVVGASVIVLSEHVDYWNRLGWKDPFSSAEFSRRQSEYGRLFGGDDIYTPQMVVDGRIGFVGSNAAKARQEIASAAREPKATVSVAVSASTANSAKLAVRVSNVPPVSGDDVDVVLAITESRLSSKVSKGENAGRQLAHTAVTRKLVKIGTVSHGAFNGEPQIELQPTWKRENTKAVVFLQQRSGRRVLGAAAIPLGSES